MDVEKVNSKSNLNHWFVACFSFVPIFAFSQTILQNFQILHYDLSKVMISWFVAQNVGELNKNQRAALVCIAKISSSVLVICTNGSQ
jgi:hypothetical protein